MAIGISTIDPSFGVCDDPRSMPSMAHEILVDLFKTRPSLAAEILVEVLGLSLPPYAEARIASADLRRLAALWRQR